MTGHSSSSFRDLTYEYWRKLKSTTDNAAALQAPAHHAGALTVPQTFDVPAMLSIPYAAPALLQSWQVTSVPDLQSLYAESRGATNLRNRVEVGRE